MVYARVVSAGALLVLLGGCVDYVGEKVEEVRPMAPEGPGFTKALATEYRDIALYEADQMSDWVDAELFARKALIAAGGDVVLPEHLSDWRLPQDNAVELTKARRRLMEMLDDGARKRAPQAAARAQARFDCWVEQQEENHQPDHIAACRDQFYSALAELEGTLSQVPILFPAAGTPGDALTAGRSFVVFFPLGSDQLNPAAEAKIDQAVAAAARLKTRGFGVTGHADRSGNPAFNRDLSARRARAVERALVARGAAPGSVDLNALGEVAVAVPTQDEIYEQANRRVEIILR